MKKISYNINLIRSAQEDRTNKKQYDLFASALSNNSSTDEVLYCMYMYKCETAQYYTKIRSTRKLESIILISTYRPT